MRGKKAKSIRKVIRQMVTPEQAVEDTQYEVINHAPKMVNREMVYPTQRVVKSEFRRNYLDTKDEYRKIKSQTITQSALQL